MQDICNKHGSDVAIYEKGNVCPLCQALSIQYGLIQLLLNAGALPELPAEHNWAVVSGKLRVLGPDWGHCPASCTHAPFASVDLPMVFGYALRTKQPAVGADVLAKAETVS